MARKLILALSSSPSVTSKTVKVVERALDRLRDDELVTRHIQLREIDPAALLSASMNNESISRALQAIEEADGLIIATPIYKASYSGLLKVFLDLLPQFALAGKAILPIATGGSLGHLLALDYGLRPVLQSMGARHIIQSLYVTESEMQVSSGELSLGQQTDLLLTEALRHFRHALNSADDDRLLGHPRPTRSAAL